MSDISVRNNLDAPHAGKESPLYRMIAGKTGTSGNASLPDLSLFDFAALWSADWWGLNSSAVFRELNCEQQTEVLARCNRSLLTEAYFIEKSGLAYSAKMVLTAKNTDEAQLFALIGADEAKHLAWLEPYVHADAKRLPRGHFLSFLSNLIEDYPPRLLVYLVQIILEGWGLDHYNRLAKGCAHPELSKVFAAIFKDEALHHRSGGILFDGAQISRRDYSLIEDALQHYSLMVRVGPQEALSIVDRVAGGLSDSDLTEVLVALRHQDETQRKLLLLRQLMNQPLVSQVVGTLDEEQCFLPVSLREAVDCFVSSR